MQIFTDIIVAILMGYLAFTNNLADGINNILGTNEEVEETAEEETETEEDTAVESDDVGGLISERSYISYIPDVLKTSSAYQKATALTSLQTSSYTENPVEALVNIFCTSATDRSVRTTTGTGFFIHDKGVILTNAHVAQYLLLQNTDIFGETVCTIRTGNPASPRYIAELLYLPPSWIMAHATNIIEEAPTGTGERDYALLYVTKSLDESPLPAKFPALAHNSSLLPQGAKGLSVMATGYPAEDVLRNRDFDNLIPRSATTTISELYTFKDNTADVFSMRGTPVGQQGSSGGPITSTKAEVIGLIATRGDDNVDGVGSLRAITTSHIDGTMIEETGFSLARNISGDIENRAQIFNDTITPLLTKLLTLEIQEAE